MPRLYFIFIVVLYLSGKSFEAQSDLKTRQENYAPLELEDQRLSIITKLTDQNHFDEVLNNILVERIVGTQSHENVKNYIKEAMTKLNWDVELDEFQDTTPNMGTLTFTNIIATLNPNAERFLLLACHYDSKYFPNGDVFLGATDSAVPCAMMINLAHSLRQYLESNRQNNDVSIKLVFFDGEEAFQAWGPKDSIYGARHLAAKWEREGFLPRIDMLILLDLLGAPKPTFYSFFQNTEKWYGRLFSAETRLADIGLLERYTYSSATVGDRSFNYFKAYSRNANIEDDHIPFLQRNVPILHIIPTPFPAVWHEIGDDKDAIDFPTIENLNKIFRIFLVEYLHLIV